MATTGSSTRDSATASCIVPTTDDDDFSCAQLRISRTNSSCTAEDLISFDDVVCSSPALPAPAQSPTAIPTPALLGFDDGLRSNLNLHLCVSSPTPPSRTAAERNVQTELRDIVDDLLRKKTAAQRSLTDENGSLRAEVSFLKQTLLQASSQPGSETGEVVAALEHERALRQNAEESRTATGKYLAEQVLALSKQNQMLETELRDFTHGREFWEAKAIAALERCEALEAENLQVKTQLNALARKQSSTVTEQVSYVLREVAEERDRLKRLEELEHPLAGRTGSWLRRRWDI
ncbi:hypothetical protein OH76DRAFT_1395980 [Lentinus brumalis]|uniref:Uncharacterized protein n=1 Tax=Lentinus brumalis TaxID=2498619 RepID=A0A371DWB0_9APHY|nr:hypothetical protein OH76DRAFT_1395980 [Polyporus brumalis]